MEIKAKCWRCFPKELGQILLDKTWKARELAVSKRERMTSLQLDDSINTAVLTIRSICVLYSPESEIYPYLFMKEQTEDYWERNQNKYWSI